MRILLVNTPSFWHELKAKFCLAVLKTSPFGSARRFCILRLNASGGAQEWLFGALGSQNRGTADKTVDI